MACTASCAPFSPGNAVRTACSSAAPIRPAASMATPDGRRSSLAFSQPITAIRARNRAESWNRVIGARARRTHRPAGGGSVHDPPIKTQGRAGMNRNRAPGRRPVARAASYARFAVALDTTQITRNARGAETRAG